MSKKQKIQHVIHEEDTGFEIPVDAKTFEEILAETNIPRGVIGDPEGFTENWNENHRANAMKPKWLKDRGQVCYPLTFENPLEEAQYEVTALGVIDMLAEFAESYKAEADMYPPWYVDWAAIGASVSLSRKRIANLLDIAGREYQVKN